jgi:hypothetical protein
MFLGISIVTLAEGEISELRFSDLPPGGSAALA